MRAIRHISRRRSVAIVFTLVCVVGLVAALVVTTGQGEQAAVEPDPAAASTSSQDGDGLWPGPGGRMTVLVRGDFIAVGQSASAKAFPEQLADLIRAQRSVTADVTVEARGPATVGSSQPSRPTARRPDIAVVELGTNDAIVKPPTPVDRFRARYRALLRPYIGARGLVCVGTWLNGDANRLYDNIIIDECERVGGTYVRLESVFLDARNRGHPTADGADAAPAFDPNDLGQRRIAERILSVL